MIRSLFSKQATELPEAVLFQRLKDGNEQAFRILYKSTFPYVKQYVLANNGKEEDAEDIFQDGMIALWDNINLGKFEMREGVKISSYLSKICRYRWLERLKSAGHKKMATMPDHFEKEDEGTDMLNDMISKEEVNAFEDKFYQLGDRCQLILKLFYYEKKSMAEIAEITGMQAASVKNEKYRCMERLKKLF